VIQYATIEDFREAFTDTEAVALSNLDNPTATQVNITVLDKALESASREIDPYLRGRYNLPFATVPSELIPHCLNIARYRLSSFDPSDDVRQRYEDTLNWLRDVSLGRAVLDVPEPEQEAVQGVGMPAYHSPGRIFSATTLRGY